MLVRQITTLSSRKGRMRKTIHYIDMFAGMGGFREGRGFWPWGHKRTKVSLGRPKSLHRKEPAMRFCRRQNDVVLRRQASTRAGDFVCMGHCEIDKYADRSYRTLFDTEGEWFIDDARKADPDTMPDFELLCGGFPCQAFSIAGNRRGFGDPRGTLFFELARLAEARKPRYLLFENVPGLLSHDGGRTFATILHTLDRLGFFAGSLATGENDRSDKREAFLCLS